MAQIFTLSDVKKLGTILSVWAHPDDETFVAGGLLAAAVQNNQQVICITATKGEKGVQDESRWPAAQLAGIRTKEMEASLRELGIREHYWLNYHDGECAAADPAEALAKIGELIEAHKPDTILTFGPDGLTGHPDHQTVSTWVKNAVSQSTDKPQVYRVVYDPAQYEQFLVPLDKKVNVFLNTDRPPLVAAKDCDIAFELPQDILQQKLRALAAQPSQMERVLQAVPESAQKGTFGYEYFVRS